MEMLTITQLAAASGWPPGRIRSLIKARKLRHIRMAGLTLVPANAIEEFVRANLVEPEQRNGS